MQPPPRGCVLKRPGDVIRVHLPEAAASTRLCVETRITDNTTSYDLQPPPRGCVLKRHHERGDPTCRPQPPPRGCVLKPYKLVQSRRYYLQPPPRGCVLKQHKLSYVKPTKRAAASARLCVETKCDQREFSEWLGSRLRAAVC